MAKIKESITSHKISIKPDYFECIQESARNAFYYTTYITWGVNI